MCGIFGVVSTHPLEMDIEKHTQMLSHRGPDDFGIHRDPHAGLGHRRLSIIDLAGSKQPIYNEDGSLCIIFNGEIYNFQELRRELIAKGIALPPTVIQKPFCMRLSSGVKIVLTGFGECLPLPSGIRPEKSCLQPGTVWVSNPFFMPGTKDSFILPRK